VTPTLAERIVGIALDRGLFCGELTIVDDAGHERRVLGDCEGPAAIVELKTPTAARRAVLGGSLGLAEGYMEGAWDTPDLDAVLDLGIANLKPVDHMRLNITAPVTRAWHALRDNTLRGSRRNISYHYDLGNDFYRLWLDRTMAYSSALFGGSIDELPGAQVRKWDRLLELLQPSSRDHLLEIGCGWGGFAIHAAKQAGCKVTGITLSEEQRDWATAAVAEAGLEGRIDIRLQDYRAVPERFDAIASIEMFEAVGERWWPVFFRQVRDMLRTGGAAALQVITIEDPRFEDYKRNPDFIQRYIFPGGMLPSPERFVTCAQGQGLSAAAPYFFGQSYARTLSEWGGRFEDAVPDVHALGFDERFVRMWRYYLSYCRAGFSAGTIDVMQVRLEG
jgi:cyclopropane-fatty-acyl-phospholipid synthase